MVAGGIDSYCCFSANIKLQLAAGCVMQRSANLSPTNGRYTSKSGKSNEE